jgi:hypothetical protein
MSGICLTFLNSTRSLPQNAPSKVLVDLVVPRYGDLLISLRPDVVLAAMTKETPSEILEL